MAPVRERTTPARSRQRSLQLLRGGGGGRGGGGRGGRGGGRGGGGGYFAGRGGNDNDDEEDAQEIADEMQQWQFEQAMKNHFVKSDNRDGDGYDSDDDLEPTIKPGDPGYMDVDDHEHVRKDEEGNYIFDYEAMDELATQEMRRNGDTFEEDRDRNGDRGGQRAEAVDVDPVTQTFEWDYYFRDVCNVDSPLLVKPTKPDSDAVLPLKAHGEDLDDWLYATFDHPSKYAVMESKVKHADSKREPRPTFPKDRRLPGEEFVNRYKGYLFVGGLVPHLEEGGSGEAKDFDDVLHQQSMKEVVAKLFGVNAMDVSPATTTSAYVGFTTKLDAKKAMIDSANDDRLQVSHPVALQKFEGSQDEEGDAAEKEFVAASPDGPASILKVTGIPANATSVELFQSMFPPGSRLEAMFGPPSKDDYLRLSPTSAMIKFASADLVAKALKSNNIATNAAAVGKRSAQVLRAKRERVFNGWESSHRTYASSKLGPRLIVTGDVPPVEMYLSHHDTMHVSGLPPHVTLEDLASFFRPFSADRRDARGSAHIVRCSRGVPTGDAYVGFELPGEIEKVREAYESGKAVIGGAEVTFRTVRDKLLRRGVRDVARPARSVEELRSDLRDWERHVDPKDLKELERLGVEKGVLDEVMLTMRHSNRTFAAADQAISGERLYQERAVGTHYRDAVRNYIKNLKECMGTKEDPGLTYWAMFYPEEEMDMGLFDSEKERIKQLRKKGI